MPGRRFIRRCCCPGGTTWSRAAAQAPGQWVRNPGAPHGPGQGALIVRPSGAEVPMGSLLSVIAVTVAPNAPATAEGAAVKVRIRTAADGGCRRRERRRDATGQAADAQGHRRAVQIGRGPERDGDPGSVTCPDRDRRRIEPHGVVAVRRRRGVQARDVRGRGSLAGERRRRPAGGHQQCRRHKRRFKQRSGVNAKHCSPPGMSGESASQLRAIRSGEYRIPGCNDADAGLKRPAPEGQRSSMPVRIRGCPACQARCLPGRLAGQSSPTGMDLASAAVAAE